MSLEDAVDRAVGEMPWLTGADEAVVELARTYARTIDEVLDGDDHYAMTKALYLGPHIVNAMKELGGSPASRGVDFKAATEGAKRGKISVLRDSHATQKRGKRTA